MSYYEIAFHLLKEYTLLTSIILASIYVWLVVIYCVKCKREGFESRSARNKRIRKARKVSSLTSTQMMTRYCEKCFADPDEGAYACLAQMLEGYKRQDPLIWDSSDIGNLAVLSLGQDAGYSIDAYAEILRHRRETKDFKKRIEKNGKH